MGLAIARGKIREGKGAVTLENLHHTSMTVSDIDECLTLYRDLLGMEVSMDMEFEGEGVEKIMGKKGVRFRVLHLKHKDSVLELLQFYEPEKTSGTTAVIHPTQVGLTHIGFTVKDIQALTDTLQEKGYEFLQPPVQTPSGRRVNYFRAHDGIVIELMQDPPK